LELNTFLRGGKAIMDNNYVVCDEHTLGYEIGGMIGILRASVLKGATFEMYPAPKFPGQFNKIRKATRLDFELYRV
jgi:hypothetical protein